MLIKKILIINYLFLLIFVIIGIMISSKPVSAVTNTGTFEGIRDIGFKASNIKKFTWIYDSGTTTPGIALVAMDLSYGNSPSGPWNATTTLALPVQSAGTSTVLASATITGVTGYRYVHYVATFSSTDLNSVPTLTYINVDYDYFPIAAYLVSSPYNTQSSANMLAALNWASTIYPNTTVRLQTRTAPDQEGLPNWASGSGWCGPNSSICGNPSINSDYSVNSFLIPAPTKSIQSDGVNDQWIQYAIWLETTDQSITPKVSSVSMTYVVNAPPIGNFSSTLEQLSTGTVAINFEVRDIDADSGALLNNGQGYVYTSLQYCFDQSAVTCPDVGVGSGWVNASPSSLVGDFVSSSSILQSVKVSVATNTPTNHTLLWTPTKDATTTNLYNPNFKIRLLFNDGEIVNNLAYATTTNFTLDTRKPTVNNGNSLAIDASNAATSTITANITEDSNYKIKYWTSQADFNIYLTNPLATLVNDSATWLSYTSTTTLATSTFNLSAVIPQPNSLYAIILDARGNLSTTTATIPNTIDATSTMIQDTSDIKYVPGSFNLFMAWKALDYNQISGNLVQYNIYRSLDDQSYALIGSSTVTQLNNQNYYTDNNLASSTIYYYKIAGQDDKGNVGYLTGLANGHGIAANANGILDYGEGGGGGIGAGNQTSVIASATPTIYQSTVATSSLTTTGVTISWSTDLQSDSQVVYDIDPNFTTSNLVGSVTLKNDNNNLGKHSVTLTNLTPNTPYYFELRSTNPTGGTATSTDASYVFTTLAGPAIIANTATTTNITNNAVTIQWNTDQNANSYVVYSASSSMSNSLEIGSDYLTTDHSVTIPGLTPNTKYYYFVKSDNARDDNATNNYNFTTDYDHTAPSIVPGSYTTQVTDKLIIINWQTTEFASSSVNYGSSTAGVYTATEDNGKANNFNVNQQITLSNLTPGATYHLQLVATDQNGNTMHSIDYPVTTDLTPDTTPPGFIINSGLVKSSAKDNATIGWATDELATGFVDYSATTTDFDNNHMEVGNSELTNEHNITLTGLTQGQKYYFKIKSTDLVGNTATSSGYYEFVALAGPMILFDQPTQLVIGETSAIFSWTTKDQQGNDLNTDGYVVYSRDDDLSTSTTAGSATFSNTHTVVLSNLTPNTLYFFQLRSTDQTSASSLWVNDSYHFWTGKDVTPPTITANTVNSITDNSAVINWAVTSGDLALAKVDYGTNPGDYSSSTGFTNTLNTNSSFLLSGLASSTTYYYQLTVKDENNNLTTSTEHSFVIKQPQIDKSIVDAKDVIIQTSSSTIAELRDEIRIASSTIASNTIEIRDLRTQIDEASTTIAQLRIQHSQDLEEIASSTRAIERLQAEIEVNLAQIKQLTDENNDAKAQIADLKNQLDQANQNNATIRSQTSGGILIIDKTDKTAPIISNIQTSDLKSDSVTVSWDTNEPADSFIEYGSNDFNGSFGNWKLINDHLAVLNNLKPDTRYNYQVASKDSSGNLSTSNQLSFTTPSLSAQLTAEGKTPEEIKQLTAQVDQATVQNNTELLLAAAKKAMDIVTSIADTVSLGTLENTLANQFDTIQKLANAIPAPVMGGEPGVVPSATSATIAWRTDKDSNSLVAYSPDNVYQINTGDAAYQQVVGESDARTKVHLVKISDLKPETTYHYQLRSKADLGPMSKSRDFTFTTRAETLEVTDYAIQNLSTEKATFRWLTNIETDSQVTYIPYRNNKLAIEEAKTESDKTLTTIHEITVDNLEGGTIYQIELSGKDAKGNQASKVIETYSTSKDTLPPTIFQVQTESALSQGKDAKVQTIISWMTDKPTLGQIMYDKGINPDTSKFSQETALETNYTKRHVAVITKFDSGAVYSFKVNVIDSAGNQTTSNVYTILTPRQKESVFQLILKNFESTFGWVSQLSGG